METSINRLTVIALHFITHMKCFDSTKAKQQDLLRPSLLCVGGGPKINKNSSFLQPHRTLKLRDEKQLCKGVYILWNGRGMNTEKAFSVLMIYVVDSVPAETTRTLARCLCCRSIRTSHSRAPAPVLQLCGACRAGCAADNNAASRTLPNTHSCGPAAAGGAGTKPPQLHRLCLTPPHPILPSLPPQPPPFDTTSFFSQQKGNTKTHFNYFH